MSAVVIGLALFAAILHATWNAFLRSGGDRLWAVTVMSFAATSLRRVHAMAPVVPTVLLMDRVPVRYRDGSLPPRVAIAGPSLQVLRAHPGYVDRVHAAGNRVHVWTVDDADDIDYVLSLGVDAVISNAPQRVLRKLAVR